MTPEIRKEVNRLRKLKKDAIKKYEFNLAAKYYDEEREFLKKNGIKPRLKKRTIVFQGCIGTFIPNLELKMGSIEYEKYKNFVNSEPPKGNLISLKDLDK